MNLSLLRRLLLVAAISSCRVLSAAEDAAVPEHLADMSVEERRAGGDEKKRYFLIRKPGEPPKEGYRALFVMPGGPGSADFKTFVTSITKFSLPKNYLGVQLVAPVWSEQQAKNNVWPLEKNRSPGMKFSTEDFFFAVKTEVEKAHRLDPKHIFTLTWSSSGSAGYTLAMLPKSGVTGSFVAMSVFRPEWLPPAARAKGHPFYLYHSREDFIPFAQAETARDTLSKAGATVELATYAGGHGWHGNPMVDIRKGIIWLEEQVAGKPAKNRP